MGAAWLLIPSIVYLMVTTVMAMRRTTGMIASIYQMLLGPLRGTGVT